MESELANPDLVRKRKPWLIARIFARDDIVLILASMGAVLAVILASYACNISFQMLGNWGFTWRYILAIFLVAPLGFLITALSAAFWGPPLSVFIVLLNGGPFKVGDRVQIIAGKHAGIITTVRAIGWGNGGGTVLRVNLDEEAEKALTDEFRPHAVMRVSPRDGNSPSRSFFFSS